MSDAVTYNKKDIEPRIMLISVCLKRAVILNASILLELKNKNLTNKLEAYVTLSDRH